MQDKKNPCNLHYIRAAVEANTGVYLSLEKIRELLIEEGLLTSAQAKKHAQIFKGYSDFYDSVANHSNPNETETDDDESTESELWSER